MAVTRNIRKAGKRTLPPLLVRIMDGSGKLIRIVKLPDPREAFCRQWALLETGETARPV